MMADPSKDLWDAASQTMMPPSQSRQLTEQPRVRSAGLSRRQCELCRWHDGQNQSVSSLAFAARQRSGLPAGVSHELPTPLNSVLILASPLKTNVGAGTTCAYGGTGLGLTMRRLPDRTAARIKRPDQSRDVPITFLGACDRTPEFAVHSRSAGSRTTCPGRSAPWMLGAKAETFIGLSQRLDGPSPSSARHLSGRAGIPASLEVRLSRLEMTLPRLEDGLAGASRAELAGIAAELIERACELGAATDALTRAHQADDDLSVGVLPPDACAR